MNEPLQHDSKESIKIAFLNALRCLLRPLVRILIKQNVTYHDAAKVLKEVYIDVANKDFKQKIGKNNTKTYISELTGIHRKDVTQTLMSIQKDNKLDQNLYTHIYNLSHLFSLWHNDSRFSESADYPLALPISGKNSFTDLARECNIQDDIDELIEELVVSGNIESAGNHTVIPVHLKYRVSGSQLDRIAHFGNITSFMLSTYEHNLDAMDKSKEEDLFFNKVVSTRNTISEATHEKFKQLIEQRGSGLINLLNTTLSGDTVDKSAIQTSNKEIGLCMFYYSAPIE